MEGPWVEFSTEWKLTSTTDAEDPLSGGRVDMFKFSPEKLELPDEMCLITKGVVIFVPKEDPRRAEQSGDIRRMGQIHSVERTKQSEEIGETQTYCYILSSPEAPPTQIVLDKYTDSNGRQAFKGDLPKKLLRKHTSQWEITATLFTGQSGSVRLEGVKVGTGSKKAGMCSSCVIL